MIFKFNYYQKRKLLKIKLPLKGLRLTDSGQDETRGPDPSHNSFDWPSLEMEQSEPDAEGDSDTVEPRRTYPRCTRNQPDRFEPGKM